jgi:hypothetical protein
LSWPTWISWTRGYLAETKNPDGTVEKMNVHSGPFFWLPINLGGKKLEIYLGFRPTPVWGLGKDGTGYGNMGLLPKLALWLRKKGFGNLGLALRIKKA